MSEAYILLIIILGLGVLAKNTSVVVAVAMLLLFKVTGQQSILKFLNEKGMEIGLTIMMVALIAPIALGNFGVSKFTNSLHEPIGVMSLFVGLTVTIFARQGVDLMAKNPVIVPMTIVGIILGVVVFRGVPVGPLIASGLTAVLYWVFKFFLR